MKREFEVTEELYATHGQRLVNYLIDLVVQILIIAALEIVIILICTYFEIYSAYDFFTNTNRLEDYLLGVLITLFYYTPLEIYTSRSISKYITGTIVVMEDGTKPDTSIIIKRTLCRLIPFDALSFLGGFARGWHDTISDTYVVQKKKLEEAMREFYELDQIGRTEENQ